MLDPALAITWIVLFPNPPIWVDFNDTDHVGHLRLSNPGTQRDPKKQGVTLGEGFELFVYDWDGDDANLHDDLVSWGVVIWSEVLRYWVLDGWQDRMTHYGLMDDESRSSYKQHGPQVGTPINYG
jgi:hypothetical protein